MKEEENEHLFSSHTLSGTSQPQHLLHGGNRSTEPWAVGEMAEPGLANKDIPEGGSSVNQYGDDKGQGKLRNTETSAEDWTTGAYSGAVENTDFGHMVEGFPATLTQLDIRLHDGEDM